MPLIYRQIIAYTIIALLSACAKIPTISSEQRLRLEQPARQYMAQGAWREAAIAWQQAANQATGDLVTVYQLNAAQALLTAGDGDGARRLTLSIQADLSPRAALRRSLILAEADLLSGDAGAALRRLGPALRSQERDLQQDYHRLRAEALLVTGQEMAAIRERSILESFLDPGPALYSNHQHLWNALSQVSDEQLQTVELQPPHIFSGWVALARLVRTSAQDVDSLQTAVKQWNLQYPAHPAGEQIIPQLFEQAYADSQPPTKVALLLPLTGPFKAAADAIRDGLLAAWFADAPNPQRPELMFRDSNHGDISNTYREALASGAEFVIGPLAKDRVAELLQTGDIQVPTLALNYPESSSTNPTPVQSGGTGRAKPVYQFALAPEDEASRAAERAFAAGHRRVALLAPQGPWGERVAEAFSNTWLRLGGDIAGQEFYPEPAKELSNSVKRLLNFDQSEQRARRLRRFLARKIKHEAVPRRDIDVIFIAAFPQAARQIKPLLQFYRAGELPVIATSHIYTGVINASEDQDLNGIEFSDMPWVLNANDFGLPGLIQSVWPNAHGALGRLYAFGADAYTLVSQLGTLQKPGAQRIQGLTGSLSLGDSGRVQRDLPWALMEQGIAHTIAVPQ